MTTIAKQINLNIEYKNFKTSNFASEETICFQANVYIDGEFYGTVDNDGKGGANRLDNALNKYLDNFFATNAFEVSTVYGPLDLNTDLLLSLLASECREMKHLKSKLSREIMSHDSETSDLYSHSLKKFKEQDVRNYLKTKKPTCIILNDLPIDEAYKIWMTFNESYSEVTRKVAKVAFG